MSWADAIAVDWTKPHPAVAHPLRVDANHVTVAWIMSPPGLGSGGHQNIFRFIKVLEDAGHTVRVYLYGDSEYGPDEVASIVSESSSYPTVAASFERLTDQGVASDVTAIVATSWETAYPSFRDSSRARRFYFVQDFEPWFYPVGSASVLAENTYRFGFTGITAGRWLSEKLRTDYGMPTHHYDFGADPTSYFRTTAGVRDEVFFYARPSTDRRGFELGLMALQLVAQQRPDVTINLAGESLRGIEIPFEHVSLSGLSLEQLNTVYNRCATGLVLSLTNMSLLPLELLAAGVIPVVNDAPNNRLVSDNPFIDYVALSPRAVADRMLAILESADLSVNSAAAAASVAASTWDGAAAQFVEAFEGSMRD